MERCGACDRPARGLVLSLASKDMVAAPRWEPYWTCERLHRAEEMAKQITEYDPGAQVLAFKSILHGPLEPGLFTLEVWRAL
jgi:hypothetical protein